MAGRPPTPPNDEEMEDIPRPVRAAAAGPIGAGAGPAPPMTKEGVLALLRNYLEKVNSIPYENTLEIFKKSYQEVLNDEGVKEFLGDKYERILDSSNRMFALPDHRIDKKQRRSLIGSLAVQLIFESMNKGVGIIENDVLQEKLSARSHLRNQGGRRQKTRRNPKKSKRRLHSRRR